MINFDKTPNDTAKALSQNFPRYGGSDNVDWEAVEHAVVALSLRQASAGLTPGETAYLMLTHIIPEGALTADGSGIRIAPNQTNDSILRSLHKKGLVEGEHSNDENTCELPLLTDLGLAVCEWLLQPFGYNGKSTTYTPIEIIEELNPISK